MKLLMARGTEFIGKKLSAFLLQRHQHSVILSRHPNHIPKLFDNTIQAISNISLPSDTDYLTGIIKLTGAGNIDKRWSQDSRKERLKNRLQTTEQQIQYFNRAKQKQAIRNCMAVDGCFLKTMLPAFKIGLGGRMADANQWMPWVYYPDYQNIFDNFSHSDSLQGIFNVPPHLVSNAKFTKPLSQQLNRLALPPFLGWLLNIVTGEMAELLIGSQRLMSVRQEKALNIVLI